MITNWFGDLAAQIRADAANLHNNHLNWAAAGAGIAAVAANNREHFNWAIEAGREGIAQIQPDGSLPLEMARGSHAMNYHAFALIPLLALANFGLANNVNLYTENSHGLARLAHFIIQNGGDGHLVQAMNGAKQDWSPTSIPWAKVWSSSFPIKEINDYALQYPSKHFNFLGGDVELFFRN